MSLSSPADHSPAISASTPAADVGVEAVGADTYEVPDWLMFVIYAIWVVAGLATCVPLVGISMYFLGDAGSNPSWLGASLMLLWALPVAMVTVFVTVLSAGLAVRASWGQSAGAAFEHALGGFFSVVFAIFNGFV